MKKLVLLTAFLLASQLHSADSSPMKARFEISGTVALKAVSNCNHPGWLHQNRIEFEHTLISHSQDLSAEEWRVFSCEFKALADGEISLQLMGADTRDPQTNKRIERWCYFDDVLLEGATLPNGDFETVNIAGTLLNWVPGIQPLVDPNLATSGSNFIAVWHDKRCTQQNIKVKKDQLLKITAKVRGLQ
jgi:hypothetical protein